VHGINERKSARNVSVPQRYFPKFFYELGVEFTEKYSAFKLIGAEKNFVRENKSAEKYESDREKNQVWSEFSYFIQEPRPVIL
jgi:hypothetical protein